MANQEHLAVFRQGVDLWNQWRKESPEICPDLSGLILSRVDLGWAFLSRYTIHEDLSIGSLKRANLSKTDLSKTYLRGVSLENTRLTGANLSKADLSKAKLSEANLQSANLRNTNLSGADLRKADLSEADLSGANLTGARLSEAFLSRAKLREADLSGADLRRVNLSGANLSNAILIEAYLYRATLNNADLTEANLRLATLVDADLSGADLSRADLSFATFVRTKLKGTILTECRIYGISAWDIELTGAKQDNLIITPPDEPIITVDNLKIAQFIYLLLNNAEIREVIDTITSKVVLILGRFTPERKAVLDAIRDELRKHNYSPVMFDFEKPASRDLTGTVSTLAHLARFIIVDLTDPSSAPHEVATVIPHTVVPVQPLLSREPVLIDGKMRERREYAMFEDLRRRYHWVLPTFRYQDTAELLASLQAHIIAPAEQKARELTQPK